MARRLAWDQGFVAAVPDRVYPAVAEPRRYADWWPGAAVAGEDPIALSLPGLPRLLLEAEGARPGTGIAFRVEGRVTGRWEWYLEAFEEGTIVNVLLDLELPVRERAGRRQVFRLRTAVRRGLVGLKETLK